MAEKVQRRPSKPDSAPSVGRAPGSAAATLNVLHPEKLVDIGGRAVEVREYGYVEGLKLQAACRAFLDGLFGAFARTDAPPSAEEISEVMADHIVTVQWMIGQSITPLDDDPQAFVAAVAANVAWVGTLSEVHGDLLTAVWWEVNKLFFTRRLQRRALAAAAHPADPSASSASTTH